MISSALRESHTTTQAAGTADPFDLDAPEAYRAWRDAKLSVAACEVLNNVAEISDPMSPSPAERDRIAAICRVANMAVYRTTPRIGKTGVLELAAAFGLERIDKPLCTDEPGVTELAVANAGDRLEYIPYSDKPLSWHTDGYYNEPNRQVRAILLHCERNAETGGESALMDHEIAYIRLRDENPDFIRAMMAPNAMTIPANVAGGREVRAEQTGPVFSVIGGRLHMRFTDRKKFVVWEDSPLLVAAKAFLRSLLAGDDPYILRHRLEPGQGIICNNVLHNRTGFKDSADPLNQRLVYRARFADRIAGT